MTDTGRIWVYVRDDRPFGADTALAATFRYSRDRRGEHPEKHLEDFDGVLQADAYAGYNRLYLPDRKPGPITDALCWSHGRRKFFVLADIAVGAAKGRPGKIPPPISPLAVEAVKRIDAMFDLERGINGKRPDDRLAARKEQVAPLVAAREEWMARRTCQSVAAQRRRQGDGRHVDALGRVHPFPARRWRWAAKAGRCAAQTVADSAPPPWTP